jgi:hypothetical protein
MSRVSAAGSETPTLKSPVRRQDDAVHALLQEGPLGLFVGHLDAPLTVRRPAGRQIHDGPDDRLLLVARGRRQPEPGRTRVGDDAHPIVLVELGLDQKFQGLLNERKSVRGLHRPGGIDQEDEVAGRHLVLVDHPGLEADPEQVVLLGPRAGGQLEVERDGVAVLRRGVVVREVIDEVSDPDRVPGRLLAFLDAGPGIGVRRGVNSRRERRQSVVLDRLERVVLEVLVPLGGLVGGFAVGEPLAGGGAWRCRCFKVAVRPAFGLRAVAVLPELPAKLFGDTLRELTGPFGAAEVLRRAPENRH